MNIDEKTAGDFFNKLADIFKEQHIVPSKKRKKIMLVRQLL